MQEHLLNSVIKITKNRDIDSLEYSLISTIQEFIECREVSVYKNIEDQGQLTIEQSLSLKVTGEKQFEWIQRQKVSQTENELLSCFRSSCIITVQFADGIERRWLPIIRQEKTVAAICVVSKSLDSSAQVMLNAFCRIFENYLVILHENERDKLTGLLNRQTFEKKIKQLIEKKVLKMHRSPQDECNRQQKYISTSWLAILDIDHFKNVNDKYGHICGDEVLLVLAQKMRHFFRSTDLIFRFGGEEFVIVFESTDKASINKKMAEFLQFIRDTSFPFINNITISAGLARISPYDFPITVIEGADKALYYAKNNGRDKFCIYDDLLAENLISGQVYSSEIDLF